MIMETASLKQLFIYPVKSLQGISLSTSRITPLGLEYDRRWMIVDATGQFITQRLCPQLALVNTSIESDVITLSVDGYQDLHLPLSLNSGDSTIVKIWRDQVKSLQAPRFCNEWISRYLGVSCRFVYMPDTSHRPVSPEFAATSEDHVSFADGFPFLIISQYSLDNLNTQLKAKGEQAVPIQRFRPNLFVDTTQTLSEDHWQTIIMGENQFHIVKPCARCIMTTIDASGKKGKEPLATLLQYRKQGQQAYFGQNAILNSHHSNSMMLSTGDSIKILKLKTDE